MYVYVHGGDIYSAQSTTGAKEILDFSVNINPLGVSEEVKKAIAASLEECDRYPDPFCRELTAALSDHENTAAQNILCANGASDLIFRLSLALKPQRALLLAPTFADYEKALKTVGCEIAYYNLTSEHDFCIQPDFLDHIQNGIELLYLCNPNNPTGQLCSQSMIRQILDKCQATGTIVLVDECFMDFVDQPEKFSAQFFLEAYKNLIILKAFTKSYALAGIRLGYVLTSNHELINALRDAGQDWNVSTVAQAAGICALKQKDYLREAKILIRQEKQFLLGEMKKLGLEIFGSEANYIFFKVEKLWLDLDEKLLAHGILIRSCANYVNLDKGYFRIAVKNHAENERLIAALQEVVRVS